MHELFASLPFPEISPEGMAYLSTRIQLRSVKGNAVLIAPGQVCDSIFFVLEGGFVCRYIDLEREIGKTINVYLRDMHPFMACIDSYFTQTPTRCELRAIADSTILQLKKQDLDTLLLLTIDLSLQSFYQEMVVTALREENDLKLKIIAYPSEQLYRYFLENFPMLIQSVPSKYIAELMGISAEWLSKLKRPR